jgi:plasmid stabilization system protein ParE
MSENRFRLKYLQTALDDLIGILDYIAQHSIERAYSFVEKIERLIESLESNPLLGRIPRRNLYSPLY